MVMEELNKDIYLLGTGIKGFSHITLETNYTLKNCNEVYYINPLHSLEAYLKKINPKSFNLIGLYKDFRSATDVYEEITRIIIKRAKEISKISFLSHGNPIIFSTPTQIIIKKAKEENLTVEVLPAISAIDSILTELKIDIGDLGLQIFDANKLVLYEQNINTFVPCVIFQIGIFGSKFITRSLRNKPHRFKLFKQYLLKFYPEEHIVYLIESAVDYILNSQKSKFPISDIETKADFINTNSSLYIPPVKGTYIRNKKFYSLINNPNNINELVYQCFKK